MEVFAVFLKGWRVGMGGVGSWPGCEGGIQGLLPLMVIICPQTKSAGVLRGTPRPRNRNHQRRLITLPGI